MIFLRAFWKYFDVSAIALLKCIALLSQLKGGRGLQEFWMAPLLLMGVAKIKNLTTIPDICGGVNRVACLQTPKQNRQLILF